MLEQGMTVPDLRARGRPCWRTWWFVLLQRRRPTPTAPDEYSLPAMRRTATRPMVATESTRAGGCAQPGLETGRGASGMGQPENARLLRRGAPAGVQVDDRRLVLSR